MTNMPGRDDEKTSVQALTGEKVAEAYLETMKNVTRAAIFDQLHRKKELTATEISKILSMDVDVVYYHMKFLRKMALVSEPRVEVKGNYIEKYYSLTPETRKSIAGQEYGKLEEQVLDRMGPEEFRRVLMTAFALIQSLTAGAANQIKRVDEDVIAEILRKRNISINIVGCTEEYYYESLKKLREIVRTAGEAANHGEMSYTIAFWAMPKID